MPYIALEQMKNNTEKGIYIIDMDYPLDKWYVLLQCCPIVDSPEWEYVKTGKRFIPDGRA